MKKFIVIATDHTKDFDDYPYFVGAYDTEPEAEAAIREKTEKDIEEIPNSEEVELGIVQAFDENRNPVFGRVYTTIELM